MLIANDIIAKDVTDRVHRLFAGDTEHSRVSLSIFATLNSRTNHTKMLIISPSSQVQWIRFEN